MAEWFRAHKPALKRVWIVKDLSLEYSKATADYFKARWKQLGGNVCGEDTFIGRRQPRPLFEDDPPARRGLEVRRDLRRLVEPVRRRSTCAPCATRASRRRSSRTRRSTALPVVQNNPGLSNFYALGFACLPPTARAARTRTWPKVNASSSRRSTAHADRQPLRAPGLRARGRARGGDQEGRLDGRHEDRGGALRLRA